MFRSEAGALIVAGGAADLLPAQQGGLQPGRQVQRRHLHRAHRTVQQQQQEVLQLLRLYGGARASHYNHNYNNDYNNNNTIFKHNKYSNYHYYNDNDN